MAAIITDNYRVFNAKTTIKSLEGSTPDNYLYFFIGRPNAWTDIDENVTASDTNPPIPIDSVKHENAVWRNMLALKRVQRSDVSLGVRKREWSYGTYYDIYRHDYGTTGVTGLNENGISTTPATLSEARYYVVTENGNVYICLDNNNSQNPSTENPENFGTGTAYAPFQTSDGYIWKYVTSVSPSDYANFSTLEFHPVRTVDTQPIAGDPYEDQYFAQRNALINESGAIFTIRVKAGGSSTNISSTIASSSGDIEVLGDGTGLTFNVITNSSGGVTSVEVTNFGSGYTYCYIKLTNSFTGVKLTPILTPIKGLGSDPVRDLNAYFMLVYTQLAYAEGSGDFTVGNDYRQVGMVTNPLIYNSTAVANQSTLDASTTLELDSNTFSFTADSEVVCGNGTTGRVVDWDPVNNLLRVIFSKPDSIDDYAQNQGFNTTTITQVGSGTSVNITAVTNPEVESFSGELIYYENRRPISRDPSQIEELHIAIEY